MRPPRPHLLPRTLALAALLAAAASPGWANDRPFQVARTAVMEDDEQTWSFESWVQRFGRVRGLSFEPEYTFTTATSVQVELSRYLDRAEGGGASGQEAEVEFKHLFNNIARDGYGWGLSLALNTERTADEGRRRGWGLKLPVSVALGEAGGTLHLNVGLSRQQQQGKEWVRAAAYEHELFRRTHGFAEWAREGEHRFAQLGLRHWLRKEKLALDLALQQHRSPGAPRASGFVVGLGWYDL